MTTYDDIVEGVAQRYNPRAITLLARVRDACRESGMTTDAEAWQMWDDQYRWALRVWRPGVKDDGQNCIDISIEIAEEREYDDPEGYGLNFGLNIVEWGGLIIGGLSPYNYTPEVWVDSRDDDAIEDRWSILEDADVSEIPTLIAEAGR